MSADESTEQLTTLPCKIVTPTSLVFEGEVESLEVAGSGGTFEVLPRHEAVLSPLSVGIATAVIKGGQPKKFAIHGGFLDMDGKSLTILADAAEEAEKIDMSRAEAALARAKERLAEVSGSADDIEVDIDRAKLALLRATLRISLKDNNS